MSSPEYVADPAEYIGLPAPDLAAAAAHTSFDLRLAIGEVHAGLARRTVEPVEAIDQVIALVRDHDRRASHEGPTVSGGTARRRAVMGATQKQINVSAALHGIANGVVAGMPEIHAITVGVKPITVQVCGKDAANVDAWLAYFDEAAQGAVTDKDWVKSGDDYYSGRVTLAAGEVQFWTTVPGDLKAENERLRAELAALRADVAPPAGDAVAGVAASATAPDFELGKAGEHYMASGTKGDKPGDCGAECVCGVGFYGFDTLGEAVEHLDKHIVNPDPRDAVDPFHVLPDNTVHSETVSDEAIDGALTVLAQALDADPSLLDDPALAEDLSVAVTGAEDVACEDLRTPDEWQLEYAERQIMDPDGWRGVNGRPWTDPISREEFLRRRNECTMTGPIGPDADGDLIAPVAEV